MLKNCISLVGIMYIAGLVFTVCPICSYWGCYHLNMLFHMSSVNHILALFVNKPEKICLFLTVF